MNAPGPLGRRLCTGEHRGHLELCAVTRGRRCDLECLELEHLLGDLERAGLELGDQADEVDLAAAVLVAAVAAALVAFWSGLAWLLWSVFS